MNDSLLLRAATVQEIQLELLQEIDRALGMGRQNNGLVSIWWD